MAVQPQRQSRGESLIDVDASGKNASKGEDNLIRGLSFINVSARASPESPMGVDSLIVHGKNEDILIGILIGQRANQFQSRFSRQSNIDN